MVVKSLTAELYARNRHVLNFTVVDADASGSPAKDLTGKILIFALSEGQSSPDDTWFLIRSDTSGQLNITDATNGLVEAILTPSDTTNDLAGAHYFELEVFDNASLDNGVVVATGTLTILVNLEEAM